MRRKGQEELVRQFFQENQMRHGEIMGIITDQALDAILHEELKEQVFALTPASSRSQPQGSPQMISQGCLTRVIFGSRHCKHRIASSSNHPCLTAGFIPQIANSHGLA